MTESGDSGSMVSANAAEHRVGGGNYAADYLHDVVGYGDLTVAEGAISSVLSTIADTFDDLDPADFASGAHVPTAWLGQGSTAQQLAHHHARAHQVLIDTLTAVQRDIARFDSAVREAKTLVLDADSDAQQQLGRVLTRTESLGFGQQERPQAEVAATATPQVITETAPEAPASDVAPPPPGPPPTLLPPVGPVITVEGGSQR